MSTFRLEPEHFHLTTGTFNLLSKTDPHFRLSGAFSVRPNSLRNLRVLETFQSYAFFAAAVNPLRSQDFHLISTVCITQEGSFYPRLGMNQSWRTLCYSAPENALPSQLATKSGASRSGRQFIN